MSRIRVYLHNYVWVKPTEFGLSKYEQNYDKKLKVDSGGWAKMTVKELMYYFGRYMGPAIPQDVIEDHFTVIQKYGGPL